MFNFLMRKLIKSKLKGVPEAEQEKILLMVEKNPALFQKIATEIQEKVKSGKDQNTASMEVMMAHRDELQAIYKKG